MSLGSPQVPGEGCSYVSESPVKSLDVVRMTPSLVNSEGKATADWLVPDRCGPITMAGSLGLPASLDHSGPTSGAGGE